MTLNVSTSRTSHLSPPLMQALRAKLVDEHGATISSFDAPIPNIMRWQRHVRSRLNEETKEFESVPEYISTERMYLILYSAAELAEAISSSTLVDNIDILRSTFGLRLEDQLYILIDGFAAYSARRAALALKIERELTRVQVAQRCFVIHTKDTNSVVDWVYNMTADLGIRPHKHVSFLCISARRLLTG